MEEINMKTTPMQILDYMWEILSSKRKEYCTEYSLPMDNALIIMYPYNFRKITNKNRCNNGTAITDICYVVDDESLLITDIGGDIYIPTELILSNYICFNCNKELLSEYYCHILKHEFGHILHARESLIGRLYNDGRTFDDYFAANMVCERNLPKLRTNSSLENRLRFFVAYNNMPLEKGANDMVGISNEEIEYWERLRLKGGK